MSKIKKFLPLIIFLFGLVVLLLVYFFIIRSPKKTQTQEEPVKLLEVALIDRPIASLTPTSDGHWLTLKIEKIELPAATMDYELLYELPDGRTQGVPGTITLNGQTVVERKLLLGSESSGKFRYDEGVKEGTLTLRFRNDQGKLIARFITKFALLGNTKELFSVDNNFKASLSKIFKGFFVVMETFGIPKEAPGEVKFGPWGIFTSATNPLTGSLESSSYKIYRFNGSDWSAGSFDSGIFIGTSE